MWKVSGFFKANIPSLKLKFSLKMDGWNTRCTSILLGWPIFRSYVSFRESIYIYIYLQCCEVQARLAELCGMAGTFASLVMVLWAACMSNVGSTSDGNCTEENMLLQMEERHHVSHMKAEKFCDEIPELCEPYMTAWSKGKRRTLPK